MSMDLSRKPNETYLDYHKRIIYGKLVDKTLGDLDYSELSDYAYGQHYSSDVARRMFYGSRRTLDLVAASQREMNANKGTMDELDEKINEFKREKQKFFDQRREYNKLQAEAGRREHLYEHLSSAAESLSKTVGDIFEPKTNINTFADNEAVIVLSDWHYGMITHNAFNTYNTEICKQRVQVVIDKAVDRIQQHQCNKLHVIVLGDLGHFAIHTSARVASEELAADQLMQVSEILAQAIIHLSQFVPSTDVYVTYGNHARIVQNKNDSIHRDNMERLIPWWLETRILAEERVRGDLLDINIKPESDNEFISFNVCGHDVVACHGDLDSVKASPRMLSALFHKKYGKDVEYILLGDKHHREDFEELGITSMLCGALCGTDDYANDKRLFSTPSQLLLIFNPNDGLDAEYRLKAE